MPLRIHPCQHDDIVIIDDRLITLNVDTTTRAAGVLDERKSLRLRNGLLKNTEINKAQEKRTAGRKLGQPVGVSPFVQHDNQHRRRNPRSRTRPLFLMQYLE
jgi:hypothetical protein